MSPAAPATRAANAGTDHAGGAYWRDALAPYARPHLGRSLLDLLTSVVPYLALSVAMYQALQVSYLLTLLIAVPASGFLVRTFILFHDCSHGSLLPSKRANIWLGRVLGLFVYSPFLRWRHDHAIHHATAGDLDRRGGGDVRTLTVSEYMELAPRSRLAYRSFRNPLIMFGIGPIVALVVGPRIVPRDAAPAPAPQRDRDQHRACAARRRRSAGRSAGRTTCSCRRPTVLMAGSAGIWLFYVQHQFEDAYWESAEELELRRRRAARKLLPEAAQGAAVLLRQHRPAPRSPPQRAHSQLQPAARARREPDLPRCPDPDASWTGCAAVRFKLYDEERGQPRHLRAGARRDRGRCARDGAPQRGRCGPLT